MEYSHMYLLELPLGGLKFPQVALALNLKSFVINDKK